MRRLVSIFCLASFLLASALASVGDSYAGMVPDDSSRVAAAAATPEHSEGAPDAGVSAAITVANQNDACPCKNSKGHAAFLCGVTLALLGEAGLAHKPAETTARFVLDETGSRPGFVDQLKRPPRTIA